MPGEREWVKCVEPVSVWGGETNSAVDIPSDRPGVQFQPGPGSNFLAGVLILAGAGDFWSRG